MLIKVRFGSDVCEEEFPEGTTLGAVLRDNRIRSAFGYGDNVEGNIGGSVQSDGLIVQEGMVVFVTTRGCRKSGTVCSFCGIDVCFPSLDMDHNRHHHPHFHARYNEYEASIRIDEFAVLAGKLPWKKMNKVKSWTCSHKNELMENWKLLKRGKKLKPILGPNKEKKTRPGRIH